MVVWGEFIQCPQVHQYVVCCKTFHWYLQCSVKKTFLLFSLLSIFFSVICNFMCTFLWSDNEVKIAAATVIRSLRETVYIPNILISVKTKLSIIALTESVHIHISYGVEQKYRYMTFEVQSLKWCAPYIRVGNWRVCSVWGGDGTLWLEHRLCVSVCHE